MRINHDGVWDDTFIYKVRNPDLLVPTTIFSESENRAELDGTFDLHPIRTPSDPQHLSLLSM